MSKLILKWSRNSKLGKDGIISFPLPAGESCPMAGTCKAFCYAKKGFYVMPTVKAARAHNFAIAKRVHDFVDACLYDLAQIKEKFVRVHDSGDFFNQSYLDAWIFIAQKHPEKRFYAYTKSLHLDFSRLPSNFHVIQSAGGRLDHKIDTSKPHSVIFPDLKSLKSAGYLNTSVSDLNAAKGGVKIGLVYH